MSEYQQNIDYNDVFNFLTFNQVEQSELLSIHSQNSGPSQEYQEGEGQMGNKKELPTSDQKCTGEGRNDEVRREVSAQLGVVIDFNLEVRARHDCVLQGSKDDTVELNINFKTIIFNHFKELLLANELSPAQAQRAVDFGNRSPSFKSLSTLCERQGAGSQVGSLLLRFVQSPAIIRRILESRCRMMTKMQMIKFVEVLRLNVADEGRIVRWKEAVRR